MQKPLVNVAAAIIRNEFGQVYLTERLEGKDFAQALEFPGGKLKPGETPLQGLTRELEEEIGIQVLKAELFSEFDFDYPTKIIHFYFYLVEEWVNKPFGREGQKGMWINQQDLDANQFPPANYALIQRLQKEQNEN